MAFSNSSSKWLLAMLSCPRFFSGSHPGMGEGADRPTKLLMEQSIMPALYEKYRPSTLDDVVGQAEAVNRVRFLQQRNGIIGKAFWIKGPSASGKTTLAKIMASSVTDDLAIEELDAQDLTLDKVREFSDKCRKRPLFGNCWAFVANEAHNLRSQVVSMLQTVLEEEHVQRHGLWIFTTTDKGHKKLFDDKFDSSPFLSRAITIELTLTPDKRIEYAQRLMAIAQAEGLDNGKGIVDFAHLMARCELNFRKAFGELESGCMFA